ncbi:hypothetical protein NEF87_001082 [Candidatus Lokiarchaeum ossiferum]|uniref:Amidohydrolase-related domain-containing protein n=1 Tax=Candidatus Lokiarchaeum ossiferum TaxID=2951803 RepID=A0ABY6HQX5_9ARCH|nr:hypothetical protein NEF87_001082 [Candidatus Lokiarchaeum sp. B-35]
MVKNNSLSTFASNNLDSEYSLLPSKYIGPKFDAHTHVWSSRALEKNIQYAQDFNIQRMLAIVNTNLIKKISPDLHDMITFARFFPSLQFLQGKPSKAAKSIDKYYSQGFSVIKLWFAPRFSVYTKKFSREKEGASKLSNPMYEPMFSRIEDLDLVFLVHNSDPDIWYQNVYVPESKYGSKESHLHEFEEFLKKYPKMKVLGAHFGAQPENLVNLGRWFDTYPNFYVDASSARWMARELSRNPANSNTFLKKYHNRILWGSDLSFGWQRKKKKPLYYYTRYLTYQALFETNVVNLPLPFTDPDSRMGTVINGLDLPLEVLEDIYWKNASKLFSCRI